MRSESPLADKSPALSSPPAVRVHVGERVDPEAAEALWRLLFGGPGGRDTGETGAEGDGPR